MAELTIWRGGEHRTVEAEPGALLSDVLNLHHQEIEMPCGGQGRCKKCRVRMEGDLSPATPAEVKALGQEMLDQGYRLACCTRIRGDAAVWMEESKAVNRILVDGIDPEVVPDPFFRTLGAAVDIGTTTLAARLYDRDGLIATATAPNPQRTFGADVISRIESALAGKGPELAACVRDAIGALLQTMAGQAGRRAEEIDFVVITGNTTMLYLLTETDVHPLSAAPFEIHEQFGRTVRADSLGLPVAADAQVYLTRCISAFVGGDITTALLASQMYRQTETTLMADIGTNGEIVLWHQGVLRCCSTAAGPAFEGTNIQHGMQGAPGAIDHAAPEHGGLKLHTIGEVPAVGICGSGVVDVLASLLTLGTVDETGLLDGGAEAYALAGEVAFTQEDIRQVQLAKSAVCAGMETLLAHSGVTAAEVARLDVAGGFGSYLDLRNAGIIGLIPRALVPRARVLGNAALSGAAMILRSRPLAGESEALADAARTVDLSADPIFSDRYIENMLFTPACPEAVPQ